MRYIPIEMAKPDMVIGNDLFDVLGRLLMSRGSLLTSEYIDRLKDMGIAGVFIDDDISKGIEIEPPISPALRSEGMKALQNKDLDLCKNVAKRIVEEIMEKGKFTIDMTDLRSFDNYTFAHSVNVAVLSCAIGMGLNFTENELEDIVLAGLLHDIGKLEIPYEILNKKGRLTPEEFAIIKTHPQTSYDMICDRLDISSFVKHAILSHHENYDGSGYPNGLAGDKIGKLARILHVADAYDALTSKRPFKEPYTPFVSIEILEGGRGTIYDPASVDAFLEFIPLYPKGSIITLSDGREAIVLDNSEEHNLRPLVRTMAKEEIDLSTQPNNGLSIAHPCEEDFIDLMAEEKSRSEMLSPISKVKIMIIDPDGELFESISKKLDYIYDFVQAKNDYLAEGYLRKYGYPALIIVDADGRNLNDEKKIERMNKRVAEKCPVIVVGSQRDLQTIQMFRRMGIYNYILKPFKTIYIQSEIRKLIHGWDV